MMTMLSLGKKPNSKMLWLVKSGHWINGPFTTEEIIQKIRSKEIVAIDEVSPPKSRWRYLREEPVFKAAIDEMRRGMMSSREDTEVQLDSSTATSTATDISDDMADLNFGGRTGASLAAVGADYRQIQDAEFTERPVDLAPSRPEVRSARVFGLESEAPRVGERSVFQIMIWVGAIALVVLIAIGAFVLRRGNVLTSEMGNTIANGSSAFAQAEQAWAIGDWSNALRVYRQIARSKSDHAEAMIHMGLLSAKLEGQTVVAKRMLQDTLPQIKDVHLRVKAHVAAGIVAVWSDERGEARRLFVDALQANPKDAVVLFNLAMVDIIEESYLNAVPRLREAMRGDQDPAIRMMLAKALMGAGKEYQIEALELLEGVARQAADFQQEALVLSAYLDILGGNRRRAVIRAREAFDIDPEATEEHRHNPFLYIDLLSWNRLVPICRELDEQLKAPVTKALLVLCLAKSAGGRDEANRVIEDALAKTPDDELLNSARIYLLLLYGRDEEARAALRFLGQGEAPELALLAKGRACQKIGDLACAEEVWQSLLQKPTPPLAALSHLARIKSQKGEQDEADTLISRAESRSPTYVPVLRHRLTKGQQ